MFRDPGIEDFRLDEGREPSLGVFLIDCSMLLPVAEAMEALLGDCRLQNLVPFGDSLPSKGERDRLIPNPVTSG